MLNHHVISYFSAVALLNLVVKHLLCITVYKSMKMTVFMDSVRKFTEDFILINASISDRVFGIHICEFMFIMKNRGKLKSKSSLSGGR